MKTTQKIWRAGSNTLVVTIPKNLQTVLNLEEGDYLEIDINKIENETTNLLKEELPKTKNSKNKKLKVS